MEQCDRHHRDLYYGDEQNPGLTTRVLLVERAIKNIQFYGRWALLLLLGAFVTGLANLLMAHK